MFDFLNYGFNQRALLAVLMIGFSNGALGSLVVLRKNSLVISALSHSLLPGIALAMLVFGGMSPFVGLAGAMFSAMVVGLATVYVSRKGLLDHQTALTVLFTSAFAGGLLMLEHLPGNVKLADWLFGNILGLRNMDLWMSYIVSFLIVLLLAWYRRGWILYLFEPSIAASMGVPVTRLNYLQTGLMVLALVTSLQAVGAVLSSALFIIPTATMLQWVKSPRALIWSSGALGSIAGMVSICLSNWWDVQTGATLILLLGCCFMVSLVVAPKR
ncbi:metal ABC transporter permease [Kiritimatiellaeota bacterium B1221]|nr:metal ABC transporter permease [Kiritimatiellaeota bacterium B1221]